MLLGLSATAVTLLVLLCVLYGPRLRDLLHKYKERSGRTRQINYDPGRERRAEQRARELLRSCVEEHEWLMYRDLGFLRVWGKANQAQQLIQPYAYLIYPHKPIVAYLPQTNLLLNEYCVTFPDHTRPYGSARLPDADDVLAKWMALTADERRLISDANMHLPGRQIDPATVQADLNRLARWEREWDRHDFVATDSVGSS